MFILFDARCEKCHNSFKAEVDGGRDPVRHGRYSCVCPRCYTVVTVWGEHGTMTGAASGWPVRATAVTDAGGAAPDAPT